MTETIRLTLELPEVNRILLALGKLPYEESYRVIEKIREQAQAQLAEPPRPEPPDAAIPESEATR